MTEHKLLEDGNVIISYDRLLQVEKENDRLKTTLEKMVEGQQHAFYLSTRDLNGYLDMYEITKIIAGRAYDDADYLMASINPNKVTRAMFKMNRRLIEKLAQERKDNSIRQKGFVQAMASKPWKTEDDYIKEMKKHGFKEPYKEVMSWMGGKYMNPSWWVQAFKNFRNKP